MKKALHGDLHFHLFGIGLVPAEQRRVMPMPSNLSALVPKPTDNIITVKSTVPDTEKDTMPLIIQKSKRTAWQTKKLASKLIGETLAATLRNDSNFILSYIKYEKDHPDHEQIRSPRRLIYDRKGDCDCFAVCIASLLLNQGVSFRFRIAKYETGEWAHIYVIVPKNQKTLSVATRSDYTVLDPVTNKHDYEVPYLSKKDYNMLQSLDGFGTCVADESQPQNATENATPVAVAAPSAILVPLKSLVNQGLIPTVQVLQNSPLPFVQNDDDTVTVSTPQGLQKLPAVLTPVQANQVAAMLPVSSNSDSSAPTDSSGDAPIASTTLTVTQNNKWLWILGAAAAFALITSGRRPLAGIPAGKRKKISLLKI